MKYKCKKRLVLDRYNDDVLEEYSDFVVEIGEVYEKKNVRLMIASDHKRAIHLEDDNANWIEILPETLSEYFEEVQE